MNNMSPDNTPLGTNCNTLEYIQTTAVLTSSSLPLFDTITWEEYYIHLWVWESRMKQYPCDIESDEQNMSRTKFDGLKILKLKLSLLQKPELKTLSNCLG